MRQSMGASGLARNRTQCLPAMAQSDKASRPEAQPQSATGVCTKGDLDEARRSRPTRQVGAGRAAADTVQG